VGKSLKMTVILDVLKYGPEREREREREEGWMENE
jgi:hypothetical protein